LALSSDEFPGGGIGGALPFQDVPLIACDSVCGRDTLLLTPNKGNGLGFCINNDSDFEKKIWLLGESNSRPPVYKTDALPTELRSRTSKRLLEMEGVAGNFAS
jgi:hypothetical protein